MTAVKELKPNKTSNTAMRMAMITGKQGVMDNVSHLTEAERHRFVGWFV